MRFLSGRVIIGLFIIVVAVLLLLNLFGVDVEVRRIWSFWPIVPLVIGLNWLVLSFQFIAVDDERKVSFSWGQFLSAIIAISIGVFYLGNRLGYFTEIERGDFWTGLLALVLLGAGISLLRGRAAAGRSGGRFAFLSGVEEGGSTPWKLESGSYFAFMGGIDLDLTAAEIPPGETVLDVTAFMGGIDIKIPQNLAVIYEGSAFLGGVSFKGHEEGGVIAGRKIEYNISEDTESIIRIQARAVLGGIDIKEVERSH